MIEAEARLADELATVNAFEFESEARLSHLWDKLETLETEIERYQDRIQLLRKGYLSAERQFRRAWQATPRTARILIRNVLSTRVLHPRSDLRSLSSLSLSPSSHMVHQSELTV